VRTRGTLAAVFAGGMLGVLARAGLGEAVPHAPGTWPWSTFAANLLGSFLLGWVIARPALPPRGHVTSAFLGPGFCGALTTFSTFQLELVQLTDHGRVGLAGLYALASIAAGLLAVIAAGALADAEGP